MIDWILANQTLFNAGISTITVLVWILYAQLLYSGFRRQRTPRVIINRGRQKDLNALCIISNMSQEAIYVEYILATLRTSHGKVVMDVTDFERSSADVQHEDNDPADTAMAPSENLRDDTRQGPLLSGDFMHIGTFVDLANRLAREAGIKMRGDRPEGDIRLQCLSIQIIALYGPDSRPISATRDFNIQSDESGTTLTPTSWQTRQGVSYLHRRRLGKFVNKMNETNFSVSSSVRKQE